MTKRLLSPVTAALVAAACGGDATNPPPPLTRPLALVAGSDYKSGALAAVPLGGGARVDLDAVDAQPVVRVFGDKVYVLDQTHGAVRVYDAARKFKDPTEFTLDHPLVPAAAANPHDIYVDGPRAFVALYGSDNGKVTAARALAVVDLTAAKPAITRFIPLAQDPADPDGNPEADRLLACGDNLYVVLQSLDSGKFYAPAAPGRLAVVPLRGAETVRYIPLRGHDPVSLSIFDGGCKQAALAMADNQFGAPPTGRGGVELVDLTTESSLGLVLVDKDLGGNVSTAGGATAGRFFIDVLTKTNKDFLHDVFVADLSSRTLGARVLGTVALVPQIRVFGDKLLVLAAGTPLQGMRPSGLYVGTADGQPLGSPLSIGLPPVSLDLMP